MRYLTATLAVTLLSAVTTSSAQANHRLTDLAAAYHESVHVLADDTAADRHASHYLSRYLNRLDNAADDFVHSLAHDPYGPRTQALFAEVQSLHHRVESLLGHGCRSFPGLRSVWSDADRQFSRLEFTFAQPHIDRDYGSSYHRGNQPPVYNLDRQRLERRELDPRNLDRRQRRSQDAVQINTTNQLIGRLLSGLLN